MYALLADSGIVEDDFMCLACQTSLTKHGASIQIVQDLYVVDYYKGAKL